MSQTEVKAKRELSPKQLVNFFKSGGFKRLTLTRVEIAEADHRSVAAATEIEQFNAEVEEELPKHLASLNGQLDHIKDMPAPEFAAALAARRKPLSKTEIARRIAAEKTRQN